MKTIVLPAGCEFIHFDGYQGVGWHIAAAEFPDERGEGVLDARMRHDLKIGASLLDAVRQGRLRVRDCQTRFPLKPDAPSVEVLPSLVSLNDLREFVADLGYEIQVVDTEKLVNHPAQELPAPANISATLSALDKAKVTGNSATTESPEARQDRRLFRLRELGADFIPHGEGWRVAGRRGALADLTKEEQSAGRARRDKSDIREDLKVAVERVREGKSPSC